jgi:siroheme synthase
VPDVLKAATAQEFAARVQEAIEQDTPVARSERSQRAQAHAWESRLDQIAEALEQPAAVAGAVGGKDEPDKR